MKIYKLGDECILEEDSQEYKNLLQVVKYLSQNSKNKYEVKTTFLDFGQDWEWTTILQNNEIQTLAPKDWLDIVNSDNEQNLKDLAKELKSRLEE